MGRPGLGYRWRREERGGLETCFRGGKAWPYLDPGGTPARCHQNPSCSCRSPWSHTRPPPPPSQLYPLRPNLLFASLGPV